MEYNNIFRKKYMSEISAIQKIAGSVMTPAMQEALKIEAIPEIRQQYLIESKLMEPIRPVIEQFYKSFHLMADVEQSIKQLYPYDVINTHIHNSSILKDYYLLYHHPNNMTNKADEEGKKTNNKIVEEIFKPESNNRIEKNAIITLSPINDKVLKYLSENSQAFYQLDDREFEAVMAEIYNKLGYEVELTKATRDGGKDIIIRKPEILGDFIYYVECKKNAPKRHIGIGIIKNLVGTISTDRVNGGILATTSYFTPDARKFIADNKYDYQIQMHDYDVIRKLLDKVV